MEVKREIGGKQKEYMSVRNFLFKRSFVDMEYAYGTLGRSDGEDPLDYPAFRDNPMELIVAATEARTGKAKYFDKSDTVSLGFDYLMLILSERILIQTYGPFLSV